MKNLWILIVVLTFGQLVLSQETGNDTYTIQRLLIYNEKGEVLLERNDFGWMTPALRHNTKTTIGNGLKQLAKEFNLDISSPKIAGIFMFIPDYKPISQFRQHYKCQKVDGELHVPADRKDAKWFSISKAIEVMSLPETQAPSVIREMTQQLLYYPKITWGGTFGLSKDGNGKITHQVLENYYPLD